MTLRANLQAQMERDLRLAVLQVLEAGGNEANSRILRSSLEMLGHRPTSDQQRSALAWLEEQGLIRSTQLAESVYRLQLTERGLDVAEGRASVPGVARPAPDA